MATEQAVEAMEHGSSGLPQLDFNTWPSQIIWAAVALVLLYQLLNRIALPRISGILEERADAIADDLDRAEDFRAKAAEAEAAYDRALAEARAKAQAIAAETRAQIQAQVDEAMAKADAQIAERTAASETRIAEIRAEADASVSTVATDTVTALLQKLLPEAADSAAAESAVKARL
ncbi:MAG: F0F1 ATP synthase subunit B' [Pseudomonadota bacterium]